MMVVVVVNLLLMSISGVRNGSTRKREDGRREIKIK